MLNQVQHDGSGRGPRIIPSGFRASVALYCTSCCGDGKLRHVTVEETMKKHSRILSSIAVAAVFLGASPASAYYQAAYVTNMYSDASGTELVGQIIPECGPQQVQYEQWGTYTQYQTTEFVGYCTENGWVEL
jgi:hypothetical protein